MLTAHRALHILYLHRYSTVIKTSMLTLIFTKPEILFVFHQFLHQCPFSLPGSIIIYFKIQIAPDLATGTPSCWFFSLFASPCHFLSTSFLAQQNLPGSPVLPYPSPGIIHFSRIPVPLMESDI